MKFYRPLLNLSPRGTTIFFLAIATFATLFVLYFGFIESYGYVKTTAVITELSYEEDESDDSKKKVLPKINYKVGEKEYNVFLKSVMTSPFKEKKIGSEIKIEYNPADPSVAIEDSSEFLICMLIIGLVCIAIPVYILLKNRKKRELLKSHQTEPMFGVSRKYSEERKLYFVTDLGTIKGTCHIEDADRKILYEAVSTKFSLLADSEMEFVDHILNHRTPHLVGKVVTSIHENTNRHMWGPNIDIFGNIQPDYSTFDFDGNEIWGLLYKNGIEIKTNLMSLTGWISYTIYRDGKEIAQAINSSKFVHEEDAEKKKIRSAIPNSGFFRITTKEKNLDAIFLTLFSISRTTTHY